MGFQIALSGLNAATSELDTTANNIANVDTTGFKSSTTNFADIFATASNSISATTVGGGVQVSSVSQDFSQGTINTTNNNLDMAVSGNGFFVMKGSEGTSYTRDGAFSVNNDGYVVNAQGKKLQVFPPGQGGGFATGSLSDLQLQTTNSPPKVTTTANIGINLPANAIPPANAFSPTDTTSYTNATSMTIYDSMGNSHSATMYFVKNMDPTTAAANIATAQAALATNPTDPTLQSALTAAQTAATGAVNNSWTENLYVDGQPEGSSTLTFNTNGTIQSPSNGVVPVTTFSASGGAAPISMSLNFSAATQFGTSFAVNNLTQDGYASGRMSGINVDTTGVVSANFTNGQLVQLGKLAIANFNDPNGLQQQGGTSWVETYASGSARLGQASTSDFGSIQSGALESSNVNLTSQLVSMINAQRNFQANAQMIQTNDKITQTMLNMQ